MAECYELRVRGGLDGHWASWFESAELHADGDETVIAVTLPDQAALHGLLGHIRDLGLVLLSVQRMGEQ